MGAISASARALSAVRRLGRLAASQPEIREMADEAGRLLAEGFGLRQVRLLEAGPPGAGGAGPSGEALARCVRKGEAEVVGERAYVPIPHGDGVVGVLEAEAGSEADLLEKLILLQMAAEQLGVLQENARLLRDREETYRRLQGHAREVDILNEIARTATSGLELRPMLQRMTDAMRRGFGWEFVACVSIDLAAGRFVCEAVSTEAATEVHVGYSRPLGSGVVGRVAATAETLLLDDVRTCDFYVETLPGVLSELCLPVSFEGKVVAILNLESRRLAAFRDQVVLLETVARQIAGAIHLAITAKRLSDTNNRLEEAHEKIARLMDSSPEAVENIASWARALAQEVAHGIGAREIGVFVYEDGRMAPLVESAGATPTEEQMRALSSGGVTIRGPGEAGGGDRAHDLVVAVESMSGERVGALVVSGRRLLLEEDERRLLVGFARQLGAALEMRRLRRQLASIEEHRAATRQKLHEQGIDTLQVCPACGRCLDQTAGLCPSDGSALDGSYVLPLRLMDRYRFTSRLGQGGMGTVFAAIDERLTREVAIKLIRPDQIQNPEMRARLQREALTVARIQHPGVVSLFDSGELPDGSLFLVMERLRGRDLAEALGRFGRGRPAQVARLVRQAGSALSAAHRAGIVHRDVKPSNFFLVPAPDGFQVKLFDFGLARTMEGGRAITRLGLAIGTPAFMSPEQARGEGLDSRSDVYSLAAVAYEALLGVPLVDGFDVMTILSSVLEETPRPPSALLSGLPPEVDALFARALDKARDTRPADAQAWAGELASVLETIEPLVPAARGWPDTDRGIALAPASLPAGGGAAPTDPRPGDGPPTSTLIVPPARPVS